MGICAASRARASFSGVLPAKLDYDAAKIAFRALHPHQLDHVFGRQRLEIEAVEVS
jgi:hypothetical protein